MPSISFLLGVSGVGQLAVEAQPVGDEDVEGVTVVAAVPNLLIRLVEDHPCRRTQRLLYLYNYACDK